MIYFVLIILGLCFGSFVNALVYRLHEQSIQGKAKNKKPNPKSTRELSILHGRSMCPRCKHPLAVQDLLPVLSWLALRGKCRYCRRGISWQYPAVELAVAALFVAFYSFWPDKPFDSESVTNLAMWLVAIVGLVALMVYDIRYMLLPNRIVFPLLAIAALGIITASILTGTVEPVWKSLAAAAVGGGLFYALFQVSRGRWIGGGDVKLGFLLGLLLGSPSLSLLMIFLASLLGSLVSIPLLLSKKVDSKTRIPFGPFLITAAIIARLWGEDIIRWYLDYFML